MLSIHINLSAGAQNITGTHVIILLVCRHLLTMHLPGKAAMLYQKKTAKAICPKLFVLS